MIAANTAASSAATMLLAVTMVATSSAASVRLAARLLPTEEAPLATPIGLAIAPLLLGILVTASLAALPGWAYGAHAATTAALLVAVAVAAGTAAGSPWRTWRQSARPVSPWILSGLGCLWMAAVAYPPTVNDAVEYALATRDLLGTRDLQLSYPALDGRHSPSGFFFAWTHPPTFVALRYLFTGGGAAEVTGASARILAPWIVTVTLPAIAAAAGRYSTTARSIAPLLALATPLYFLGAATGLIDPMVVLAGTLAYVAVDVLGTRHPRRAGIVLGACLWSHSVAVLLLPMAIGWLVAQRLLGLHAGHNAMRPVRRVIMTVTDIGRFTWPALVIAAPPYLWNLVRTGHLVSDSPAVVLRDLQAWETFYDFSRGLASAAAQVQYGLLKGLFAPEAYGFTGLLACLAIVLLARSWRRATPSQRMNLPIGACWWPIAFVGGCAITMLLGTNVLVRNERMLLLVLGPSAVLASTVFTRLGGDGDAGSGVRSRALRLLVALAVAAPFLLAAYSIRSSREALVAPGVPAGVAWLNAHAAREDRVLSFRPGEFVFAESRVMTHLDPELIPVYEAPNSRTAAARLVSLGVSWVHTVDPTPPTRYATALDALLADRRLAEIAYSDATTQVYRLVPLGRPVEVDVPSEALAATLTHVRRVWNVGGRKDVLALPFAEGALPAGEDRVVVEIPADIFERHLATELRSGTFDAAGVVPAARRTASEAAVHWRVEGRGYVRAWLEYAAPQERDAAVAVRRAYLADLVLEPGRAIEQTRRVILPAGARDLRLLLRLYGSGEIRLHALDLTLHDADARTQD